MFQEDVDTIAIHGLKKQNAEKKKKINKYI
jgi:hypothetical protein